MAKSIKYINQRGNSVTRDLNGWGISVTDIRFIDEFLRDLNPAAAAQRIGLAPEEGPRLMTDRRIRGAVAYAKHMLRHRTGVYPEEVIRRWSALMRANVNEIVQVRIPACRYCWGIDHRYQFTQDELRQARQKHEKNQREKPEKGRVPFDDLGGDGYNVNKPPFSKVNGQDHDCPECWGDGDPPRVVFMDSRRLSEGAAYLYQGVEITAGGGIKLKLRDQQQAEEMVARHLGMFPTHRQRSQNVEEMSDDELESFLRANGVSVEVEFEDGPKPQGATGASSSALLHTESTEAPQEEE